MAVNVLIQKEADWTVWPWHLFTLFYLPKLPAQMKSVLVTILTMISRSLYTLELYTCRIYELCFYIITILSLVYTIHSRESKCCKHTANTRAKDKDQLCNHLWKAFTNLPGSRVARWCVSAAIRYIFQGEDILRMVTRCELPNLVDESISNAIVIGRHGSKQDPSYERLSGVKWWFRTWEWPVLPNLLFALLLIASGSSG